jgi:hypothetical protein
MKKKHSLPSLSAFDGGTVQTCGRDGTPLMRNIARAGVFSSMAMVAAVTMGGNVYANIGASQPEVMEHYEVSVPSIAMVEIASRLVSIETGDPKAGDEFFDLVNSTFVECMSMKEGAACALTGPGFSFDFGGGIYQIGDGMAETLGMAPSVGATEFGIPVMVESLGRKLADDPEFLAAVDAAYEQLGADGLELTSLAP